MSKLLLKTQVLGQWACLEFQEARVWGGAKWHLAQDPS